MNKLSNWINENISFIIFILFVFGLICIFVINPAVSKYNHYERAYNVVQLYEKGYIKASDHYMVLEYNGQVVVVSKVDGSWQPLDSDKWVDWEKNKKGGVINGKANIERFN